LGGGQLAHSLGLHTTDFAISMEGEAEAPSGTESVAIAKKKLAPLPTIGAKVQFDVTPDVKLFA
jgi:hypothetical protein